MKAKIKKGNEMPEGFYDASELAKGNIIPKFGVPDGNNTITHIWVPNTITEIGTWVFRNYTALVEVVFEDGPLPLSIGMMAFEGCRALAHVSMPGRVSCVGRACFRNCTSLVDFEIGNGTAYFQMPLNVFDGCGDKDRLCAILEAECNRRRVAVPRQVASPENVDRLSVALKVFKRERGTWKSRGKGRAYMSHNENVRSYFNNKLNWDVERLQGKEAFYDFCVRHTWMLRNGPGCWPHLGKYDDEKRRSLLEWIDKNVVKLENPIEDVIVANSNNGFVGFTNKAVSELLMKFHPDKYCLFNGPTWSAFRLLRIANGMSRDSLDSIDEYKKVMEICRMVLDRIDAAGIPAMIGGTAKADYIVVNEFFHFVARKWGSTGEILDTCGT